MHGLTVETPPGTGDSRRTRVAQRATWISAALNLLLTVAQIVVGWLAHSQSLIAHGLHSFSDLLSDFLVIYASRKGSHPADSRHPYGHARVETAATLVLGVSLAAIGLGVLWDAVNRLQHLDRLEPVELAALWIALATALGKEALYHYLMRVAERLRSSMLAANAWHTRADAASALVVVAGVGGSLLGWTYMDLAGAAIMGFMILHIGAKLGWGALQELIDTGLDEAEVAAIRDTLRCSPGVIDVHELRTRRMANHALVDAHIQVDPRISVSEGHRIADHARFTVLQEHAEVMDVLVHIDAEDDMQSEGRLSSRMPDREALQAQLRQLLGPELPVPERTVLHYLANGVEAEIFLPPEVAEDSRRVADLERRIREAVARDGHFRAISLNLRIAPR
ncbi:MAG: cation transporter [Betaproteobacteria bacterium]|nr:cation transporter [Betaproteobacteria bacterium]